MKIHEEIKVQKELVESLEKHLARNKELLEDAEVTFDNTNSKILSQLLKFQNIDLEFFRIPKQKEKLELKVLEEKTTFKMNFEKQSRECNLNIDMILQKAEKAITRSEMAPVIKDRATELLEKYNNGDNAMDQEAKNELYQELKQLVHFIKKSK